MLKDVDKTDKTPEQIKSERKALWKRPSKKEDRDKLRDERIIGARGVRNANGNSVSK
ncbi:MAG: hypothetical protein NC238_03060 [Dehalobacter sp.]|nr:hypothetical protein [Dehalobacter sp.]